MLVPLSSFLIPFTFFFSDINECERGTHKCQPPAKCINTNGSYFCECACGTLNATGLACNRAFVQGQGKKGWGVRMKLHKCRWFAQAVTPNSDTSCLNCTVACLCVCSRANFFPTLYGAPSPFLAFSLLRVCSGSLPGDFT